MIDYGGAHNTSHESTSTTTTKSWIEEANPAQPKKIRKSFDALIPKSKRSQTDEVYWHVLNEAERVDIEPIKLIAYLGERLSR